MPLVHRWPSISPEDPTPPRAACLPIPAPAPLEIPPRDYERRGGNCFVAGRGRVRAAMEAAWGPAAGLAKDDVRRLLSGGQRAPPRAPQDPSATMVGKSAAAQAQEGIGEPLGIC